MIPTGSAVMDQIFSVLCGTSMFLGGLIAFILDNTIPGEAVNYLLSFMDNTRLLITFYFLCSLLLTIHSLSFTLAQVLKGEKEIKCLGSENVTRYWVGGVGEQALNKGF